MGRGPGKRTKSEAGFVLAAIMLAACTTSDPETALAVTADGAASQRPAAAVGQGSVDYAPDDGIPRATAAGTSPIKPDIQVAFCQDQVAFMQSVEPEFAAASAPVVAADGTTTIAVTVAKGNQGIQTFECRLDATNRFTGVTSANIRGAL